MESREDLINKALSIFGKSVCRRKVYEKVNGRRASNQIAQELRISRDQVNPELRVLFYNNLILEKKRKGRNVIYKKNPQYSSLNIHKRKRTPRKRIQETKIPTISHKKISLVNIKKNISNYIKNNIDKISHPFSNQIKNLKKEELENSIDLLFKILDKKVDFDGVETLDKRFYEAFRQYFSTLRINKSEIINHFSSMIKNFEPYIKKIVFIKTKNKNKSNLSLRKELLKEIISFNSNLKKTNAEYWKNKPLLESCIRFVYPYRHIESHEARNYHLFEMEKIIFYMFSSIVLINLNLNFKLSN